jgi:TonB-linked SusC/RagA family outer membrane protein
MRKLKLLLLMIPLSLAHLGFSQMRTISGTVKSGADGITMPGVSVFAKGTTIGTISDINGKYSLDVPKDKNIVVFSFIGFKTREVTLGTSNSYDVTIEEDVLKLNEVVVTALGIKQEKKAIGYSSQNVTGDAITKAGQTNALSALSGKVAGLQVTNSSGTPGSSVALRLRGATSITGDNNPLIIVDGVALDNTHGQSGNPDNGDNNYLQSVNNSNRAVDINPDDIESINVLKGPTAAALYGNAASNGVIVITTKKGGKKVGGGVNVTYGLDLTWETINKIPDLQNEFVKGSQGKYSSYESGGSGSWGPRADTTFWNPSNSTPFNQYGQMISASQADTTLGAIKLTPYDNVDQLFRIGSSLTHNLSFSGGNDNSSYRFSASAMNQKGIVPLSSFKRYSAKIAGSSNITEKLSASASFTYTNSGGNRVQQGSNLSGLMLNVLRTPISFDNSNGSSNPYDQSAYIFDDGTQRNYRGGGGYDNPYWTINQNPFKDEVNRLFGFTQLDYKFTPWLSATYRVGTDFYADRRKQNFAINSKALTQGQIFQQDYFYRHLNSDLLLTASGSLNENFKGSLTLGNNLFNRYRQNLYVEGTGLLVSNFYNFSNAANVLTREEVIRYRTSAYFAQGQLSYKDMLYLNVTGRNEKSSALPQNNNSFFYPSFSLGWIFTESLGLTDSPTFPYGKLRASYASVGKDGSEYILANTYEQPAFADGWTSGISFPINGVIAYTSDQYLKVPSIKPENTKSFEIGADLKFFNNRLGLDFTYYDSKSKDLILSIPVPASSGYQFQYANAASMTNKGIEIIAYIKPIVKKNFEWEIAVNWSKNKNEVTELANGVPELLLGGFEGSAIYAVKGKAYGQIYGSRWLRDSNGNVIIEDDPNSDNLGYPIQDAQVGVIGDVNADWTGGFRNTFSIKNWSFSALIDIKQGGDIWNGTKGALTFFGRSAITGDRGDSTVFEGVLGHIDPDGNLITNGDVNGEKVVKDQTYYQGIGSGFNGPTEQFIEDGSYIKLREVNIGYSFPTKLVEKTIFNSLSFAVIGRNLFTSTKYTGVDPETSLTGSENSLGLDYFNMPSTRSIGFSIKLGI